MIGVRALDAHAGLVGRHHGGASQPRQRCVAPGVEARFGPAQHVGQPALADAQAEQVEESLLQALVGQGLERLQVHGRGVQARAERRSRSLRPPRRRHMRPASRAHHGQAPVLLDDGLHFWQLDVLVHADRLDSQIGRQRQPAVGALGRTVIDDRIRILGGDPAVAFVAGLCAPGPGLLAAFLAVGRGRLGRRARCLARALQLQHQFDQLVLAQALEITTAHATRESAFIRLRKSSLHLDRPLPTTPISRDPVGSYTAATGGQPHLLL